MAQDKDAKARDLALQQGAKLKFVLTAPSAHGPQIGLIVVLAGWVGCKDRHLSKFSSFLNAAGYTTVRCICPTTAIFFPTTHLRQGWTQGMLDFLDAVDPSRQRPIVLWAFSNGGAFPLVQVNRLVNSDDRYSHFRDRIQGCILDSCPCYMHASTGARALGEGQPPLFKMMAAVLFYLIALIMLVAAPGTPQKFWEEMTNMKLGRESLYLYSEVDHLCDAAKLEQLIAARRAAGHAVQAKCWSKSRHVAHYRSHPEEYESLVLTFLRGLQDS